MRAQEAEGKAGSWCSPREKWSPRLVQGLEGTEGGRTMEVAVPAGDRGEMGVLGKGQKDLTWEKRV